MTTPHRRRWMYTIVIVLQEYFTATLAFTKRRFFQGGQSLINTPRVPSNGLSHHVEPYDLTSFIPAVQKALRKLQLLRDGVSIEPIIRKIADWNSPPEQAFYVSFLYLTMLRSSSDDSDH
jgi:hypothetical protein